MFSRGSRLLICGSVSVFVPSPLTTRCQIIQTQAKQKCTNRNCRSLLGLKLITTLLVWPLDSFLFQLRSRMLFQTPACSTRGRLHEIDQDYVHSITYAVLQILVSQRNTKPAINLMSKKVADFPSSATKSCFHHFAVSCCFTGPHSVHWSRALPQTKYCNQ